MKINLKISLHIALFWLSIAIVMFAISLLFPVLAFGQAREITIPLRAIAARSDDLKVRGKWFIQFQQKDWEKTINGKRFILFPDKQNRSREVLDLINTVGTAFDIYIFEHISDGDFANGTDKLKYIAACIVDDQVCNIYYRQDNNPKIILIDRNRETDAAKDAMADITDALNRLATIATDSEDYK